MLFLVGCDTSASSVREQKLLVFCEYSTCLHQFLSWIMLIVSPSVYKYYKPSVSSTNNGLCDVI